MGMSVGDGKSHRAYRDFVAGDKIAGDKIVVGGQNNVGVVHGHVVMGAEAPARSTYQHMVRRIAPADLLDRDAELAELAAFVRGDDGPGLVWWRAEAWAGKSALLAWFVTHPPVAVRVVSFFVTAGRAGQRDRSAFTDVLIRQLAELLNQPMPELGDSDRDTWLWDLLDQAAAACRAAGQHLVLVVDGLDDDQGVTTGPDAYSIAAALPSPIPAGLRVVVSGRPDQPIPPDVPGGHPLRDPSVVRILSRSAAAVRAGMAGTDQTATTPIPTPVESGSGADAVKPTLGADPIRILMLAANPTSTERLALDEQAREIGEKLRLSRDRDRFELVTRMAVRPADLLQYLNEFRPQIVHFSGHGGEGGEILLSAGGGNSQQVSTAALAEVFRVMGKDIRVVVLNAGYSATQASAISPHIDYIIGMRAAVDDGAAAVFAAAFYSALGFDRTVREAFAQAVTAVMLHGLPGPEVPELIVRDGADEHLTVT